jgi:hypothetical protein
LISLSHLDAFQTSLRDWLRGPADDDVLRWLYRALLVATVAVAALDYADMRKAVTERDPALSTTEQQTAFPLPSRHDSNRPTLPPEQTSAKLRDAMTFDLISDGKLLAAGTIMPGTAKAFAEEVTKHGAYIRTVVLESPGGSVRDALDMGRLIREKKFSTAVEARHYCASACPLVFASGVERHAQGNAAIGVHEVAAFGDDTMSGAAGMRSGQQISAQCQTYLRDMGIDPEVWIRAMETPKDQLYYFRQDELLALKLATAVDDSKARPIASGTAKKG